MNRCVYLYELDSVRNSEEEIARGQRALFEEIVKNGNKVILSFNQLTDSEAFLCAVRNKETYDDIVELFSLGAVRISRYRDNKKDEDIRTASQYIQNALEKAEENKKGGFLFSGVPVKQTETRLLRKMGDALHYNDLGILKELLEGCEEGSEEYERLDYIIRYIRMILLMSMEELAAVPVKAQKGRSFLEFLEQICKAVEGDSFWDFEDTFTEELKTLSPQAVRFLKEIGASLKEREDYEKIKNNRTEWVNKIYKMGETEAASLSEAMADLAYNYTIEESISGASRHYTPDSRDKEKTFEKDLCQRLYGYWKDYREGIHRFRKGDLGETNGYKGEPLHWRTAVRVLKSRKAKEEKEHSERRQNTFIAPCYEEGMKKEQKKWNRYLVRKILSGVLIAVVYILIFCGVDFLIGQAEEYLTGAAVFQWLIKGNKMIATVVGSTIVFGIIGSLLSEFFKLPDILESVKNLWHGICDTFRIIRFKRGAAYRRRTEAGERK